MAQVCRMVSPSRVKRFSALRTLYVWKRSRWDPSTRNPDLLRSRNRYALVSAIRHGLAPRRHAARRDRPLQPGSPDDPGSPRLFELCSQWVRLEARPSRRRRPRRSTRSASARRPRSRYPPSGRQGGSIMKAIRIHRLGGPEVLRNTRRSPIPSRASGRRCSASRRRGSTSSTSTSAPASTRRRRCRSCPDRRRRGRWPPWAPGSAEVAVGDRVAWTGVPGDLRRAGRWRRRRGWSSCRRGHHPPGRGRHAPGDHGALPGVQHLPAEAGGRLHRPRRRRGSRPAALPDRQAARRPRPRHRLDGREGEDRPRRRRRRGDPLQPSGLLGRGQAAQRRQGRARDLRRRRQGDLREGARHPRSRAA